jgi:hypothetical protein
MFLNVQEAQLNMPEEAVKPLLDLLTAVHALSSHRLEQAKEWCNDPTISDKLSAMQSQLPLHLASLEFTSLLQSSKEVHICCYCCYY